QMLSDAAEEVAVFYDDKRSDIIDLAAYMAEKIVHEKIDTTDDGILELIHPVLSRMEQESKFITLTVTPALKPFMKERAKELEENFPLYRFAIMVDPSLEKNGCVIESANVIIDLQ